LAWEIESMNVCESWNFLLQHLLSAIDLCIPKYFPKLQNNKQPYTNHQVIKLNTVKKLFGENIVLEETILTITDLLLQEIC